MGKQPGGLSVCLGNFGMRAHTIEQEANGVCLRVSGMLKEESRSVRQEPARSLAGQTRPHIAGNRRPVDLLSGIGLCEDRYGGNTLCLRILKLQKAGR